MNVLTANSINRLIVVINHEVHAVRRWQERWEDDGRIR